MQSSMPSMAAWGVGHIMGELLGREGGEADGRQLQCLLRLNGAV